MVLCYKYVYSDLNGVMSCALSIDGNNKKAWNSARGPVLEKEFVAQNTESEREMNSASEEPRGLFTSYRLIRFTPPSPSIAIGFDVAR